MANNEEQDILTPEEDEELDDLFEDEDVESEDEADSEEIDWKAEALKNKAIAKRLKARLEKPEPSQQTVAKQEKTVEEVEPTLKDKVEKHDKTIEMWEFAEEHGLTKAQVARVFKVDPNPTAETLKDPFVKAGLDAVAKQERAADATPEPSGKAFKIKNKTWNKLTPEEKKIHFASYTKALSDK